MNPFVCHPQSNRLSQCVKVWWNVLDIFQMAFHFNKGCLEIKLRIKEITHQWAFWAPWSMTMKTSRDFWALGIILPHQPLTALRSGLAQHTEPWAKKNAKNTGRHTWSQGWPHILPLRSLSLPSLHWEHRLLSRKQRHLTYFNRPPTMEIHNIVPYKRSG